jgi:hypothetical protein
MEIWKSIKNYDGIYEVSNLGNVRSLDRLVKNKYYFILKKGKKLKITNCNGYSIIGLNKENKRIGFYVHRLVANAFIKNIENKKEVNHINGIKSDNRKENLEWNTRSENQIHAVRNKLNVAIKGEKHYASKLTEKDINEIRNSNLNSCELAKIYGVVHQTISRIINKESWKHIK